MSAVWNVFRKMTDEYGNTVAVCTVCSRSLKVPKSKTTTNLLSHLRNNHCDELTGSLGRRCLDVPSSSSRTPVDDHRQATNRRLARLIVDGTLSIEATTSKLFREFISSLNPSYQTPSVSALRNILDEENLRHEISTRTLVIDSATSKIVLTIDIHPTLSTRTSFLVISAHLMSQNSDEKFNLILDCVPLDTESFSGYTVSELVINCLRRYDVDVGRVSAIVGNDVQPLQEAALIPCVAHTIDLAVSDTIRSEMSSRLLGRVRCMVRELQSNWSAKMHMKSRLREIKQTETCPTVDIPSRWSSTYDMISDVLVTLPVFNETMPKLNQRPLDEEDVRLLEAMRGFLEPYRTLLKQVCARDAPCSVYLAVGRILMTTTEKFLSQTFGEAQRFGRSLLENTTRYFGVWMGDEVLQVSALLDPRFAYLETIQSMKSWTATTEAFIAVQRNIQDEKRAKFLPAQPDDQTPSHGTSVWEVLRETREEHDFAVASAWSYEDGLRAELQHYGALLLSSRPAFGTDPVHWWRSYMNDFPHLAGVALGYLATPATCVDSERLLGLDSISSAGKYAGSKGHRLDRGLLLLKANLNKDVARECKSWSTAELRNYNFEEFDSDQLYDRESEPLGSSTSNRSDDEKTVVESTDSLCSYMEGDETKPKPV
ncbi:hypothetical protein Q1695_004933 [Nippostrongylus brasiliensis]|nr:hypothetical protein Q1695_004933 [Nippostrongylus brasiliensis]